MSFILARRWGGGRGRREGGGGGGGGREGGGGGGGKEGVTFYDYDNNLHVRIMLNHHCSVGYGNKRTFTCGGLSFSVNIIIT